MKNKVALISGGSRGIGFGIAECLADEGWDLAINGIRDLSSVRESMSQIRERGIEVKYIQGNIGATEDRNRIVQETLNHFGRINALINNAGVAPNERKDLLEMTEVSYDRVMNINLKGTFFLTQKVAGEMIKMKEHDPSSFAAIINISSISATIASISRGEYCISKAGLGMMTSLFAIRLADHSIPVFELRPGLIATDMTAGVKGKYTKMINDGLVLQKRWGLPEDVGKAVVSLLSEKLAYSTGQVIMVDGGLSIPRL